MTLTFDPTTAAFGDERSEIYRRMRDETPVLHDEVRDTFVLTRFADVFAAANDTTTFSSKADEANVLLPMLNYLDAPRHTQLRRLVSRGFTPARVADLEDSTGALVDGLLDRYLDAGGGDLISEFAGPLAATVVGRLIGIPEDQLDDFRHLTDQLLLVGQKGGTDDLATIAAQIYGSFAELLALRRAEPASDLMSALLEVQNSGGDLSDEELLGFCFLLVGGGNDTTTNLVANGWLLLLDDAIAMHQLAEDRALVPAAIEEMLRLRPPAESHARTTTREVEMYGVTIPAGARIQLLWGAANLDEREFANAETFDIHRRPDRHLTFGHGAHFCLGASLARLEARLAFNGLLDRCRELSLAEVPVRVRSPWAFAYERVCLAPSR